MRFITQAAKVLNEQKKSKRRLAVFMCLAAVVALGTVAALKMYGQAMSHKEKRLICTVEAHRHTDTCYDADGNLVCGQADYLVHTHNDDCYGADGELVCHLPEIEAHTHTDACYTEEDVLVCTEQEQAHQHTDACYTPQRGELTCQLEEHTHGDDCYDSETDELTCQLEEHQHGDACYTWEEVLTCPYAAGGHQHSSDCYTRERGELTCPLEEHTHGDDCYDENGELTCQIEEHTHDDNCYAWEDVLTCQLEETPAGHTHTDACYEKKKILTCGQLELHTHTEDCYDENGALACGLLELKEHTHQEECFETVELTDEEVAQRLEQEKMEESFQGEDPGNAPEDGTDSVSDGDTGSISDNNVSDDETGSVSADSISGDSISGDSISGDSISGNGVSENDADVHVHDESCYDAAGGLMCGYEKDPSITQTYTDDEERYIITATYDKDANIPKNAKLKAEMITAENSGEHYAQREKEIKKTLQDESVSMNALFKIGFYVEDKEVEPESDVTVTVQFLDENGLAEGSPIAIVHFGDEGSNIIDGGKAKDRSTTFKTGKFSEFGIVEGYEVKRENAKESNVKEDASESDAVSVSETYEYEDDVYHIRFQIEGEVTLPDEEDYGDVISENENDQDEVSENEIETSESGEETTEIPEDEETAETSENGKTTIETQEENIFETRSSTLETENLDEQPGETVEGEGDTSTSGDESVDTEGLKFEVHSLSKDTDEYAAAIDAYGEKAKEMLAVRAFQYSLTFDGESVNLSNCKVNAEVKPSDELSRLAKTSIPEVMSYLYSSDGMTVDDDSGEETQIELTAVGIPGEMSKGEITESNSIVLNESSDDILTVSTEANGIMLASARSAANPTFTVEYYAYLDKVVQNPINVDAKNLLEVINTNGGKLPTNTDTLPTVKIAVGADNKILTANQLTKIYRSKTFEYVDAPSISYFNALNDNPRYELKEIWVKDTSQGTPQTNIEDSGVNKSWKTEDGKLWRVYSGTISNVHFTNRNETAKNQTYILIEEHTHTDECYDENDALICPKDNTCIRLIYEPKPPKVEDFPATLYDYDISDGWTTSGTGANTIYRMDTSANGINTPSNYEENSTGAMYAFGNRNCGTNYGEVVWKNNNRDNKLNAGNSKKYGANVFKGCTFKLAKEVDADNNVIFEDGIRQLNIFGTDSKKGKTIYGASNLGFSNKGDTYTLTRADVAKKEGSTLSSKDNLDMFNHPQSGSKNPYDIWTNNFWPLDGEGVILNQNSNDHKFGQCIADGSVDKKKKYQPYRDGDNLPVADDGTDHNCFFGMFYEVEFDLDESYCGPLEYYFFGDDDMWVFLDDTTLVCDIGGVHSSVGEYVNLWDYLTEGTSGKHTLKFFYTERGASGSSCWMQFTLPSVTSMKNQTTGKVTNTLKVGKTVENADPDKQYEFKIHFTKNGEDLLDQYSYTKYREIPKLDENGAPVLDSEGKPVYVTDPEPIEKDVIVYDGSKFFLGNREFIIVDYLPEGTTYTVEELSKSDDYNIVTSVNGTAGNTGQVEGNIGEGGTQTGNKVEHVVDYINDYKTYELPETGGSGFHYMVYAAVALLASSAALLKYRQIRRRREGIGR